MWLLPLLTASTGLRFLRFALFTLPTCLHSLNSMVQTVADSISSFSYSLQVCLFKNSAVNLVVFLGKGS